MPPFLKWVLGSEEMEKGLDKDAIFRGQENMPWRLRFSNSRVLGNHLEGLLKDKWWDFPRGPVVKTLHCQCRGHGFNSWLGTKILRATRCGQKKKKKKDRWLLGTTPRISDSVSWDEAWKCAVLISCLVTLMLLALDHTLRICFKIHIAFRQGRMEAGETPTPK